MNTARRALTFAAVVCLPSLSNHAVADTFGSGANAFQIEFVSVGNPGNAADTTGSPNPAGSVPYTYRVAKFEISEQMIDKGNAVGGLGINKDTRGADKPVTLVSWNEAARFVNWLNTSTGSTPAYKFAIQPGEVGYSANANIQLWTISDAGYNPNNLYRNNLARYFLPSAHEWYKAAYYDPTSGVYYNYPTGSDSAPMAVASGTAAGTAVWNQSFDTGPANITLAGGLSPYGTMGQGGNVWEWEETDIDLVNDSSSADRGVRGGDWNALLQQLASDSRGPYNPDGANSFIGFRVASISEPDDLGDYNGNSVVDAADYVVWRKNDGTQQGYNTWRTNFGRTAGSGAGATGSASTSVPEPAMMFLTAIGVSLGLVSTRRRRTCVCPLVMAIAVVNGNARLHADPFFMGLGDLPGGLSSSHANGVSADGSVVVGGSESALGPDAFRWTVAGGIVGLGDLPGDEFWSSAFDVSADGLVVIGSSKSTLSASNEGFRTEAFRWTPTEGIVGLGDFAGGYFDSQASAISDDGSVIVGFGRSTSGGEAFRWTQANDLIPLGDLTGGNFASLANDVSADGSVVVGGSASGAGFEAMRWTQAGGMVGLGDLPGGDFSSTAFGVSPDGSVVVGQSHSSVSFAEAFRWTLQSGMVGLGLLPGSVWSAAKATSANGSLVVGTASGASGSQAFVWDEVHGMRNLKAMLIDEFGLGSSLAGWTLTAASDISGDGRTIVGSGTNPSGQSEGWVATIPAPLFGDYNDNGVVDAADYVVWRKNDGTTNMLSNDSFGGMIDSRQYNQWRANFGRTTGTGAGSAGASPSRTLVPEPTSLPLLALSVIFSGLSRFTRRGTTLCLAGVAE